MLLAYKPFFYDYMAHINSLQIQTDQNQTAENETVFDVLSKGIVTYKDFSFFRKLRRKQSNLDIFVVTYDYS